MKLGRKNPTVRAEKSPTASGAPDRNPLRLGFKDRERMGTKKRRRRRRKKGGETNMFNVQSSLCVSPFTLSTGLTLKGGRVVSHRSFM